MMDGDNGTYMQVSTDWRDQAVECRQPLLTSRPNVNNASKRSTMLV